MEGLKGAFDVVFRGNRGHVEAVAAGSLGQCELFHSVDEVSTVRVMSRLWLNDKCLVFKCDEAPAETAVQYENRASKQKPIPHMQTLTECGTL